MKTRKKAWKDMRNLMPSTLAEAEEFFGADRVRWPSRKHQRGQRRRKRREYCDSCEKQGYLTESQARRVIERMLSNGSLCGPGVFTFKPYLCPQGYWHTGHDWVAGALIMKKVLLDQQRNQTAA